MKPLSIILHHELGNNGFYGVNDYHRQLWNFKSSLGFYIAYQYYIDHLGVVYQGRADDEEGAHTIGRNLDSIGICLAGNFDISRPTEAQLVSLKSLILRKMTQWTIHPNNIFGHRIYASYKSCPGNLWKESELKDLFNPDRNYYIKLLDSLKDLLMKLQTRKLGSTSSRCITSDSRG